jgi:hypothetical protein
VSKSILASEAHPLQFCKTPLDGQQGHGRTTRITDDRTDIGLFDSAPAFQSDAIRFDYAIQVTARAVAGSLQSMNRDHWTTRKLAQVSVVVKSMDSVVCPDRNFRLLYHEKESVF